MARTKATARRAGAGVWRTRTTAHARALQSSLGNLEFGHPATDVYFSFRRWTQLCNRIQVRKNAFVQLTLLREPNQHAATRSEYSWFTAEHMEVLVRALQHKNNRIERLLLASLIDVACVQMLMDSMRNNANCRIRALELRLSMVNNEEAELVARVLESPGNRVTSLIFDDVSDHPKNDLAALEGIKCLARAMTSPHNNLAHLELPSRYDLSFESAMAIAEAMMHENCKLKQLHLAESFGFPGRVLPIFKASFICGASLTIHALIPRPAQQYRPYLEPLLRRFDESMVPQGKLLTLLSVPVISRLSTQCALRALTDVDLFRRIATCLYGYDPTDTMVALAGKINETFEFEQAIA